MCRQEVRAMSQRAVSVIVDRLVTDQDVRDRFTQHRLEVLVDLQLYAGIELTADEIAAFVCADLEAWFSDGLVIAVRLH